MLVLFLCVFLTLLGPQAAAEDSEANALLKWKHSFDNHSQSLLSTWRGNNPCTWKGIQCDKSKSVSTINLSSYELKGTLHTLSFSILPNLLSLNIYHNSFHGTIPPQIGNLTKVNVLNFSSNSFHGSIPQEMWTLGSLHSLDLSLCHLSGELPNSMGNLSNLSFLDLGGNNFSSTIPPGIGKLHKLQYLGMGDCNLFGSIPQEIGMLTNLELIDLSRNSLSGTIPETIVPRSLKNCSSIARLRMEGNQLEGDIAQDFGVYPNLAYIDLSDNKFHGHISPNWGKCHNLYTLKISNNNISGVIPIKLAGANKLGVLHLSSNHLSGKLPKELGNLKSLFQLKISNNHLSGNIPTEIGLLQNLEDLDLGDNELSGPIPIEVVKLHKLRNLNLSKNNIGGSIPSQFSQYLVSLDLSSNLLIGTIPTNIGELQRLFMLNLSHNSLSGTIPSTFGRALSIVNISDNQLEGPIPNIPPFLDAPIESLKNNKGLCGDVRVLDLCPTNHSRKSNKVILVTFLSLGALVFVLCGVALSMYIFCRGKRKGKSHSNSQEAPRKAVFSVWSYDGKIMFENIIEATENFDDKYLIGAGSQGYVYKVVLPSGLVVAVKKLHSAIDEEMSEFSSKAFASEIKALTEIKHRNIIKLHGFCSHSQVSFLVYQFMEGGSLDQLLNKDTEATAFDWEKRVNVVKGLANALSYLHHDCSPPIVHRDISSKNVLLDLEYEAHVSDFGTAKFLKPSSRSWTEFAGTFGYAAPDQRPPQPTKPIDGEVILIVRLALACLSQNPRSRPTMEQVSKAFGTGKSPSADLFPRISLGQLC
ncbi:MDIS1-interacting receptor like kinase [Vigna angularis]|uniref:non-specific serine/threonine protein kinase n=1 Tax=Phaseolus angularis TaxID=3914 RepID=A0A8T0KXQ7_PHAAN|nr:MDIS1-interacting receptor like kinase [Vigna angularis]